ncbi:2-dehydropantoate 2-reductase [Undibacterium sp.]|jgi:2-dehydropantoate 2-reductase|uniref:2-dehydropantoate 2-reductase n=1 Tax=Undibacterium sp. TaxID=1914977 RepID=UPI002C07D83E|nr:2-dehydropantoate 2-reductase [Undibacterium sp.]HTD05603.1 2-dehydropantoate 2-reductase [Undibacterium sp.]
MRILVVGAGAVGGYFGGRMLAAGRDVTFLVRAQRSALLAKNGLQIKSPAGDLALAAPPTVLSEQLQANYDLIILSCKAYDLDDAINSFSPAVAEKTMILPLLNGMRHLDVLEHRFGKDRVLGGQCAISSTVDAKGAVVHLAPMHMLTFGERDGSMSERIRQVLATMSNAGFDPHASENILQSMWEKWVLLASLAGSTCLMRSSIGDIMEAPGGRQFVLEVLEECRSVAVAAGYPPGAGFFDQLRNLLTTTASPLTASMFRDIENHARIEADQIIGNLIERGQNLGLKEPGLPLLRTVYTHLKSYEAKSRRAAS